MDSFPPWYLVIFIAFIPEVWTVSVYLQPQGSSHAFFTNDSFFISCTTKNSTLREQLEWLGPDGQAITSTSGRLYVEKVSLGNYSLGLVVEQVRSEDAGEYTCTTRTNPKVSASTTLIVYKSIDFMDTPLVQTTPEDRNFTVRCNVQADPKPIVSWHVNGQPPNNRTKYHAVEGGLIINKVTREDAGNYTCRAISIPSTNSQLKELHIRLDVLYGPEWKLGEGGEEVYGTVGSVTNLTCQALGVPRPTYQWLRNGALLRNGSAYSILHSPDMSVLQVAISDASMFGTYVCKASGNDDDQIEKTIELSEGVVLSTPVLSVERKGPGTIGLTVKSPTTENPLPLLGYRIEYRQEIEEDFKFEDYEISQPQPYLLKNLAHNTVYVLRASAKNAAGYGTYSEEVTVKTQGSEADNITGGGATCRAFLGIIVSQVLALIAIAL